MPFPFSGSKVKNMEFCYSSLTIEGKKMVNLYSNKSTTPISLPPFVIYVGGGRIYSKFMKVNVNVRMEGFNHHLTSGIIVNNSTTVLPIPSTTLDPNEHLQIVFYGEGDGIYIYSEEY